MQTAILIDWSEWDRVLNRLDALENQAHETKELHKNDSILTVREAALHLNVAEESVRRARRAGRLKGFKINEKEYGFYQVEINRYKTRYQRGTDQRNL
jgi:hypothetical protein